MLARLLLSIGGLVLLPAALFGRARWLLVPAVLSFLIGLILLATRIRIVIERSTGIVYITESLLGVGLRKRRYLPSDVADLDLQRVAGSERERPSDTWYLRLRLQTANRTSASMKPRTRTYLIGRYDSRLSALRAQRRLQEVLRADLRR